MIEFDNRRLNSLKLFIVCLAVILLILQGSLVYMSFTSSYPVWVIASMWFGVLFTSWHVGRVFFRAMRKR